MINLANIDGFEIAWTVEGMITLTVLIVAFRQCWRIYQAVVTARINGLQRAIVWQDCRHELERLTQQAAFLLIGIVMMATPPPVRIALQFSSLVAGLAFIYAQTILLASSIRDQQMRRRNLAAILQRQQAILNHPNE